MKHPSRTLTLTILCYGFFGGFVEVFDNALKRLSLPLMEFMNGSITSQFGIEPSDIQINTLYATLLNIPLATSIIGMFVLLPLIDGRGRRPVVAYLKPILSIIALILVIFSHFFSAFELIFVAVVFHGLADSIRNGVTKLYLSECAPNQFRAFTTEIISAMMIFFNIMFNYTLVPEIFGTVEKFFYPFLITLGMCAAFILIAPKFPESPKYLNMKSASRAKIVDSIIKFHGKNVSVDSKLDEYDDECQLTEKMTFRQALFDPQVRSCYYLVFVVLLQFYFGHYTVANSNFNVLMIRFGWSNTAVITSLSLGVLICSPIIFVYPVLYECIGRRFGILFGMCITLLLMIFFAISQMIVDENGQATGLSVAIGYGIVVCNSINFAIGGGGAYSVVAMDIVPMKAKLIFMQAMMVTRNVLFITANYLFVWLDPLMGAWLYLPLILLNVYCIFYFWSNFTETKGKSVASNCRNVVEQMSRKRTIVEHPRDYGSILRK